MGGSADQRYNLSFIFQNSVEMDKPMIGISIQYRLTAFGFLSGKEFLQEVVTNLRYRDQRSALHWIQENIEAFGGDPKKVTIWGESAGGQVRPFVSFHVLKFMERGKDTDYGIECRRTVVGLQ